MKLNRFFVILLALTIAAGAVFSAVAEYKSTKSISEAELAQFKSMISLPNGFTIISSDKCCSKTLNSIDSVYAGIKSGAGCIEISISFKMDGTPVLAEGMEYVNNSSVSAEDVFRLISKRTNLKLIINLKELSEFSKLLELLNEYKINDRVFFSDIDKSTAPYVTQELPNSSLIYTISSSDADLADNESCTECIYSAMNCGASAIRCPVSDVTDTLMTIARRNMLRIIITDADSDLDLYKALAFNPDGILTDNPDRLYNITISENLLVR